MTFDLRILRSALVPIALIVCVTVALWELRAQHLPPRPGRTPITRQAQQDPGAPSFRPASG